MTSLTQKNGTLISNTRKRIITRWFLATICSLMLLLQGCAPLILALGAGAGYLATDKQAARKVDRFLQDLGKSIETSSRRISGNKRTEKKYRYKKGSGPTVRLQKTSLTPTTVHRGDSVTSIMIYGVLGAPADGLTVREKRELWFKNKKLSTLRDESIIRASGTWKSRLVFKVPESANNGTYFVKQQISFKGKNKTSKKKFIVR